MPASQLKRLKASLREQGITGQQKSKKEKKSQNGRTANERIDRNAALQQIRDSFNPFELRQARPAKFESVSHKSANNAGSGRYKEVLHRPGVSKSAGEEMRRATLLPEMHRRNKVGGLVDRRIGEGDPGMTPEERAIQRFAHEKQRKKGASMFDLEASDDEAGGAGLTHMGRRLDELDGDDFNDAVSAGSDEGSEGEFMRKKRTRSDVEEEGEGPEIDGEEQEQEPERKKSKKEVMEEVIAKSKFHKYERQKAKEDDEDIREELDKGMSDMLLLLRGHNVPPPPAQVRDPSSNGPTMNPDRQRLLDGMDRVKADKEYEVRMRQLAQDTRAQPSNRTKTEEEKVAENAQRLKKLEEKRMKRMRGEEVSDDEAPEEREDAAKAAQRAVEGEEDIYDEAADFGFASSTAQPQQKEEKIVLDDEDEFALDEDLIADGSEIDVSDMSSESEGEGSDAESEEEEAPEAEDEEDEFVRGILGDGKSEAKDSTTTAGAGTKGLAFTYPCPRSHEELLDVVKAVPAEELPTVVQRIRALHHPSLSAANKEAMSDFACALVDHISYMGVEKQPLAIIEQLIRHLHSLSRSYTTEIATAFRKHLQAFHERGQPTAGDLVILTAIGSIYPTSDHFHQVVTPAITLMARYLGLNAPVTSEVHAYGSFMVRLCMSYQKLSKRYVPEAVRFTLKALSAKPSLSNEQQAAHLSNLVAMADMWKDKSAFTQMFAPFLPIIQKLHAKKETQHLRILLQQGRLRLKPLELHNHRPLPLRTSVPKFEESFNPDKHYDPDKERSDSRKLQKEYKRERKGAVRELRKDANFVAREQLRDKRERDAEYEKKYRKLVAEIQGEEGHESKQYEREKRMRKGKR